MYRKNKGRRLVKAAYLHLNRSKKLDGYDGKYDGKPVKFRSVYLPAVEETKK